MVLVENLAGLLQVEVVLAVFVPRQVEQQLQVVELHGVLGRHEVGALQFLELLIEEVGGLLVPLFRGRAFAKLVKVLLGGRPAKFLLDGLHLLVEDVLALLLLHLLVRLGMDPVFDLHHLLLVREQGDDLVTAFHNILGLKNFLFLTHLNAEIGDDEVDEEGVTFYIVDGGHGVAGHAGGELQDVAHGLADDHHLRLELLAGGDVGVEVVGGVGLGGAAVVGARLDDAADLEQFDALHDHHHVAVWDVEGLEDAGDGADAVEVLDGGVLHAVVALGHHADGLVGIGAFACETQRLLAPHGDGDDHAREEHGVAHGQQGHHRRQLFLAHPDLILRREDGDDVGLQIENTACGKYIFHYFNTLQYKN